MKKLFYNFNNVINEYNALVVDGNLVAYLGDYHNLELSNYECYDLKGRVLLPSFLDAHSHFISYAISLLKVDLKDCTSIEMVKEKIRGYIKDNNLAKGEYIRLYNFDQNNMKEERFINLDDLVEFNDYYVVIEHVSSHMAVFNQKVLSDYEVSSTSGLIKEDECASLLKRLPMNNISDIVKCVSKAQNDYYSYGISLFHEGMMNKELLGLYKYLVSLDIIKTDIYGYASIDCYEDYVREFSNTHLVVKGVKLILDGSPQGKSAYMKENYLGDNSRGIFTSSEEEIAKHIEFVIKHNTQLIVHANGNAAISILLNTLKKYKEEILKLKYPIVIIHGQLIDREDLDLVKELKMVISYFVSHVYYWGDVHIKNFGMEKASYISPLKSTISKGIVTTIHNDTPVLPNNLLESAIIASERITKNGVKLGEEEKISLKEAILNISENVGKQYVINKGKLEVGSSADFIILDSDKISKDSKVDYLYVEGELRWKRN